jgi:hypothetical protein
MSSTLGIHLVEHGIITREMLAAAVERQVRERPLIGQLACARGVLTSERVDAILESQRDREIPFGELAVELGYMHADALCELLELQKAETPGLIDVLAALRAAPRDILAAEAGAFARRHPPAAPIRSRHALEVEAST